MSIYFRNTPVSAPFMFESLGNHWNQVNIFRPDGYPYYHYLQTEKGTGRIEVRGKFYTLGANEGILIAPGVPHSYHRESTSWTTMFATFTGTLAGSIPYMTDNQEVILVEKEQGASIRKMISSTLRKYHQPTPDMKSLSSDCYNFLMNFTDCAASPKIQDNPLYQRYVIPVIKEIETGYQQDITAAQLSRSVFVSPQYLSRLFRRFMGCSVYEYVTMYRISRARELLLSRPDMKIQDFPTPATLSPCSVKSQAQLLWISERCTDIFLLHSTKTALPETSQKTFSCRAVFCCSYHPNAGILSYTLIHQTKASVSV